ncbi:hypothetical protein A2U01_0098655, partial [Trifolium medium]|nr:hypothetical protein [Trifolium medium]
RLSGVTARQNPKVPVSKRHTARPGKTKREGLAKPAIPSLGEHSMLPQEHEEQVRR